ncbi:EamA family transporter [filamentous cyanobacterium CCP5]|nr:EamA family transporter [filamentous cyanobacterium CCP5]
MGSSENQAPNQPPSHSPPDSSAEEQLYLITEKLRGLQQHLSSQITTDIDQLMRRRSQLMSDIEQLEGDYEQLQTRYTDLQQDYASVLSDQQQAQQQLWAKRLAQAIATHLQRQLKETLTSQSLSDGQPALPQTHQTLNSLDQTLHATLRSLERDIESYQGALSQQMTRMHSLEQQGETILAALINRLSQQLQTQLANPPVSHPGQGALTTGTNQLDPAIASGEARVMLPRSVPGQLSTETADQPVEPVPKPASHLQKGLILVVLSTLALSVHNVLVGIIGFGGQLLGRFPVAATLPLDITNSLLLLWLRMVVVLPLMMVLAERIYPRVWRDMRQFIRGEDRRPVLQVIASGSFLFMSQVLIYKAISEIGPGVAVTLLFMYPLITVPLAWFLFGDRPTPLRLVVMFAITMGIVFTALPRISVDIAGGSVSLWGVGSALLSSAAFALYLVSMQLSFRRLHPVPVSLLQFSTIFVLTSLILIVGSFLGFEPSPPSSQWGLYLGGIMLGVLTLLGYLFNNFGVRLMGAAQAAIVASSGPVVTAILAFLIIPGDKTNLAFIQWIGVVLVTLGLAFMKLERLIGKPKKVKRI